MLEGQTEACDSSQEEPPTPPSKPLLAARKLFARYGYHGTSIRAIAREAGLSVPSLYHYYPSKQAILEDLVHRAIARMLDRTRAAAADSDGTVRDRFNNVVEALLLFHLEYRNEALIASSEMRSMDPDVRQAHVAQRDTQQKMVQEIIDDGIREGLVCCRNSAMAARAISSLCVSVADWYRPDGPLSAAQVARSYREFAWAMLSPSDGQNGTVSRDKQAVTLTPGCAAL